MTGDERTDEVVVALHHLAAAEVTVALKVGGRILDVGEQERDVAAELLLQEVVEFEALTEQLLDPLGAAGRWPGTRVVYGAWQRCSRSVWGTHACHPFYLASTVLLQDTRH